MQALICDCGCGWNIVDEEDFAVGPKCPDCGQGMTILKGNEKEVRARIADILELLGVE